MHSRTASVVRKPSPFAQLDWTQLTAELVFKTGSREWVRHLHASQLGDGVEVDALEVALVRHGRQLPPPGEGQGVRHMAQRGRQHCRRQCLCREGLRWPQKGEVHWSADAIALL